MTPITTNRSYVHELPLCAWTGWTCPYLPFWLVCKQCLSKVKAVGFSNLVRKNVAHLLSNVRAIHAPRIICLPKSMPATEHKHNHCLIVLMRLQLEMPQCCRLAKEQNKHQIHLEKKKKKSPWLSCKQAAGWSRFQIYGVQAPFDFFFLIIFFLQCSIIFYKAVYSSHGSLDLINIFQVRI